MLKILKYDKERKHIISIFTYLKTPASEYMKAESKDILDTESRMILDINTPREVTSKVFFLLRSLNVEKMMD